MTTSTEFIVLAVEDDEVDLQALRRSFRSLSIDGKIHYARDGIEALQIMRGDATTPPLPDPYVILLDLNMPIMNGHEFLATIRADEKLRNATVFVLTTSDDEADKDRAFRQGVAGYIIKPCEQQSLADAISMISHYWRTVEKP